MQKTYIVMVTPHNCAGGGRARGGAAWRPEERRGAAAAAAPDCGRQPRLAARYDDPYGAVADYDPEVEARVLKAVGE